MAHCLNMNFSRIKKITLNNVQNRRVLVYVSFAFRGQKKGGNLLFFPNLLLFFPTVTHHNISKLIQKYNNTMKEVLISIKSKFSDRLFNFYEKNANLMLFRKIQIIFNITKKLSSSVSLYFKKSPMLYGIKIKIIFKIYIKRLNMTLSPLPPPPEILASATKKGHESFFFTVTHHKISQLTQKYIKKTQLKMFG